MNRIDFYSGFDQIHWNKESDPCRFQSGNEKKVVDHTTKRIGFDERDIRRLIDLYDAGIRQLDTELGRLFEYLEEAELP